jgi:type I restriction enzyme S subunit
VGKELFGRSPAGQAIRSNLFFVPQKRISTAIPNAKRQNQNHLMNQKNHSADNIPQLRFPEFVGEWERKKLGEVADKITDGTHDTPKPVAKGIPFLTAIHIKDGFVDYENCYYLMEDVHNSIYKRCNPEKYDLLIVNIGAGTATCALNIVDYEFSLKNVALVKPNKKVLDGNFLAQAQRTKSSKIFTQLASGGAQPFLSLKEIGKLTISFPTLPEQTRIANFLTAVDEKIQALKKKKGLLEAYKKGVMQKLFSQELRFKGDDGQAFADWEVKKLGEVGETYGGLSGKTKEDFGKGKLYIQYKQIFDDSKIDISRFELVNIGEKENQNKVQFGDVFFTVSSETPNEIGMSSVLLNNIDELYLIGLSQN